MMGPDHLVPYLEGVVDIEKLRMLLKQWIADALGCRMEQASLFEVFILAGSLFFHGREA